MRAYYCDHFVLPLPDGHRFPMTKYRRLREEVLATGLVASQNLLVPDAVDDVALLRVHDPEYLEQVKTGGLDPRTQRRVGFPWSPELVERSRRSAGGTVAACRAALEDGTAVNLAGGTHHAFRDRGEGFCVFNDAAVAARAVQAEDGVRRVLVIDCDVHQGNGTASIFQDDPTVFTFSIHGRRNFPFRKETSDLDVPLDDGTGDEEYLDALEIGLERSLDLSAADLAIYVSGADPYEGDKLGRLALTQDGLARRDRLVLGECHRRGLPVAVAMAGGYAPDVEAIVAIHLETVRTAAHFCGG